MDDLNNNRDLHIEEEEESTSYFCRFTFGQFFTILVLEVITLAFVFYLGAKYGTNYLKVADEDAAAANVREIVAKGSPDDVMSIDGASQTELQSIAKDAMKGANDEEIKARVRELLAKNSSNSALNPPANVQAPINAQQYPQTGSVQQDNFPTQPSASKVPPPAPLQDDQTIADLMARAQESQAAKVQPPSQQQYEQPQQQANSQQSKQQGSEQGVVRMKSPAGSPYSIQVGSYPSMEEASSKVDDWRGKGYAAFMMIADIPDRGRWYRVRIGGFPSKEDAQTYLEKFRIGESTEAIIVLNEQ